jgi:thymidylate synthase
LSDEERLSWMKQNRSKTVLPMRDPSVEFSMDEFFRPYGVPKRAISLMWNQRSCDVGLGIPFNIASYGLLLEIIAKIVNMVPDELIGNLGDCHIYNNHVEGIKEQLNREPFELPKLKMNPIFLANLEHKGLDEAINGQVNFELENYQYHPSIKLPLSN